MQNPDLLATKRKHSFQPGRHCSCSRKAICIEWKGTSSGPAKDNDRGPQPAAPSGPGAEFSLASYRPPWGVPTPWAPLIWAENFTHPGQPLLPYTSYLHISQYTKRTQRCYGWSKQIFEFSGEPYHIHAFRLPIFENRYYERLFLPTLRDRSVTNLDASATVA